jgi:hypothetical protein
MIAEVIDIFGECQLGNDPAESSSAVGPRSLLSSDRLDDVIMSYVELSTAQL